MYLLDCVFTLDHCICTLVESNPFRVIAHPVEGISFQVQGAFEKTVHLRGRF